MLWTYKYLNILSFSIASLVIVVRDSKKPVLSHSNWGSKSYSMHRNLKLVINIVRRRLFNEPTEGDYKLHNNLLVRLANLGKESIKLGRKLSFLKMKASLFQSLRAVLQPLNHIECLADFRG